MKYKAILFDMDGVLIESEFLMRHSAIQALADYGITAKHEDFLPFTGRGEDKFVGGVAEKYGLKYEFAMKELAYDYYGKQVKEMTEVPEGIKEMLMALHEKGIVMAVCSAADLRKVRYNIQAIGVDERIFAALVTGSDVARKKPFPDIYLEGARRIGIAPEDCLVVEDAVSGIQAAHAAGMEAVAVPTTFSEEVLRQQANPDYMLNHIKELTELFK